MNAIKVGKADKAAEDDQVRTFDTRMSIVLCMNELLATQSFEKLTVKEVCHATGISRTTFYNHFYDKFEVYQWHLDYLYREILAQAGRSCTFREANCRMLTEVTRLSHLYQAATFLTGRQSLGEFAQGRRERDLMETLVYHRGHTVSDKLTFQIVALVDMEVEYVLRWIKEGMPISIEEMADGLDEIVPRDLFVILNSPPKSR